MLKLRFSTSVACWRVTGGTHSTTAASGVKETCQINSSECPQDKTNQLLGNILTCSHRSQTGIVPRSPHKENSVWCKERCSFYWGHTSEFHRLVSCIGALCKSSLGRWSKREGMGWGNAIGQKSPTLCSSVSIPGYFKYTWWVNSFNSYSFKEATRNIVSLICISGNSGR